MQDNGQEKAKILLKKHRKDIEEVDLQLIKLLKKRFEINKKVAILKHKHKIPAFIGSRVVEVRARAVKLAEKYGVDKNFVHALYTSMIMHACLYEEEIESKLKKK